MLILDFAQERGRKSPDAATSKYMKAYGEVPEQERGPLDDQIGIMIALVEELESLISGKQRDS